MNACLSMSAGTVLIVDDEPIVREVHGLALASAGFGTTTAADGAAALRVLADAPDVVAVLADVAMPGMDGLTLADEIRRRRPGLPVLVTTGLCAPDIRRDALAAGAADVIWKPVNLDRLVAAVQAVVRPRPGSPAGDDARAVRVLVADDEPLVRDLCARALRAAGYAPVLAADGVAAFNRALARPVEAAFVDVHMPELGGCAALGALRRLDPHLTLVAITGGGAGAAREALAAGAMACLQKPLDLETIGQTAARAVAMTRRRRQTAPARGVVVAGPARRI